MTYLLLLGGLVLLAAGGEFLVRGAVGMSRRLGVSPLLAGLTIVGFGTSTPELVTSIQAALRGSPGIALGNIVGSNIANILLILGVSALILPLAVNRKAFRRDGIALVICTLAATGVVLFGEITRLMGVVLLAGMIGYIVIAFRGERQAALVEGGMQIHMAEDAASEKHTNTTLLVGFIIGGLVASIVGANLLVEGAITLARSFGISEAVIGVSVVALGTSLPELIACVVAALRKHGDVALGNIVGSNIYNVFGILGITALVQPLSVPPELIRFDIWVLLATTFVFLAFLRSDWQLSRFEGGLFLIAYATYCVAIFA